MTQENDCERPSLSDFENKAMHYQAHNWTLRLVDRTRPSTAGSAVPIKIGPRYFLATAAHVIPSGHKIETVPRPGEKCISIFSARQCDVKADVGLLEVPSATVEDIGCRFLPEQRIFTRLDQKTEMPVMVVGYPGEYMRLIDKRPFAPNAAMELRRCDAFTFPSVTLPLREWPSMGCDTTRDLFISFDPENALHPLHPSTAGVRSSVVHGHAPRIQGMSGGGIWLEHMRTSGRIWQASALLIGLQVRVHPKEKWMRGTVIRKWLSLVAKNYPDLQENIAIIDQNIL